MLVSAAHFARFRRVRAHYSCASFGTNRAGQQIPHPHQVVRRRRKGEYPPHLVNPAMSHLAHQGDRLQPAEALRDPLLLTDRVPGVARGPLINRAAAGALHVLCHVRRDPDIPALRDKVFRVVRFVGAHRDALVPGQPFQHHQRRIPFRRATVPTSAPTIAATSSSDSSSNSHSRIASR